MDKWLGRVNTLLAWTAAILVLFMMFAISYSVFMRFVWNEPVPWVVEISSYLMLYITFLGTAWLLQQDGHVELDLLLDRLSPRARAVLKTFTSLGGAVVAFILAWKGSTVTVDYYLRNVIVIGILNTPQFILMAIIPVGGFLLLIQFLLKTWHYGRIAFRPNSTF